MTRLVIFYDSHCGVCGRFRKWMERQPSHLELEFVGYDTEEARRRFPELAVLDARREIVVRGDDGSLWQGPGAWVTCLWALTEWRDWARRLASPVLLPLAARICQLVSENRMTISKVLRLKGDAAVAEEVARAAAGREGRAP